MQRLTGLDASFAHLDTPTAPLGVAMVCAFDHSEAPEPYSFHRVRRTIDERLRLIPPMRRRLVDGTSGIDRPHWIEDPDFELDHHLRRLALPDPGGEDELAVLAAEWLARPFDRDRPLWDMALIERFGPQRTASITRLHHAAIDGVSGAEALANFLDLEPDADPPPGADDWRPDELPSNTALWADAARAAMNAPVDVTRRLGRTGAAGFRLWRQARDAGGGTRPPLPYTAPRTPLNGRLSGRRAVGFARIELSDLDRIRHGAGASVNDVVLALCAGSLRAYLARRDALPDRPLVAAVPVSARGDDPGRAANQVSGMLVELATERDGPLERLQHSVSAARAAKEQHRALGPTTIADLAELAPSPLLRGVAALDRGVGWSSRVPPVANVVISNIPGPPVPLYFAGARLLSAYPIGPVAFGAGLNITAQSYCGVLHIGLNACPDLVEDVGEIAAGLTESTKELLEATAHLDVGHG